MIKRSISIILSFIMLICFVSVVFADGTVGIVPDGVPSFYPYYTTEYTIVSSSCTDGRANYISIDTFTIVSTSTGKVSVSLSIETNAIMKKLGFTTLRVQHWNGSSWEDVWTKTDQYLYDTDFFPYVKTLSNMASNDYYRVSVDFYAKKGFLQVQTLTVVSNYILCQ